MSCGGPPRRRRSSNRCFSGAASMNEAEGHRHPEWSRSTCEATEQSWGCGPRRGGGGGKDAGRGELVWGRHTPDAAPGKREKWACTGAGSSTEGQGTALHGALSSRLRGRCACADAASACTSLTQERPSGFFSAVAAAASARWVLSASRGGFTFATKWSVNRAPHVCACISPGTERR